MHGLDLDLWWIYFSWQRYNTSVKFPCIIHVEGGQLVEARERNRVLPSALSSVFNNINSSVHIFLKYRGAIPGASPVWATCWKGESAYSGLSSFQNLSLLIDSYHSLSGDAVSSGRGVFLGYLLSHHSFISEDTSLRKTKHLPPCWQFYQGRAAAKWVRLVVL